MFVNSHYWFVVSEMYMTGIAYPNQNLYVLLNFLLISNNYLK